MTNQEAAVEVPRLLSFRDFPWRWRDISLGYLPFLLLSAILFPFRHALQHMLVNAPNWTWIILSYAAGTWMFLIPICVVWKRTGLPRWPRPRVMIVDLLLAIPLAVVSLAIEGATASGLIAWLGESTGGGGPIEAMLYSTHRFEWIALYILGIVVAPLGEEPFHRGMLYNALRQRIHWGLAAVFVSVVFAIFHPYGIPERVGVFVSGLFLAGFYEWRKTLFAPMALHALMNCCGMTALLFTAVAYENSPMIGMAIEPRDNGGLVVKIMPGSGAEIAGIQVGDIIREVDGRSVREVRQVFSIMQMHKFGDSVTVKYLRDGKPLTVEVRLKERPK